jgi:flagellar motor switch/type III secretory pathway protein FliN
MSDFFHQKGILSVVIGEGWLSSFEAGSLKAGDVVRTGHFAGRPSTLRYNGREMGPCEVVTINDVFGVRVTGTEPVGEVVAVPGTRDDFTELLPTEVVLGSIKVSLAELRGVGRNTIISLGKPWSTSTDAELWAAGIPLAQGKVVAIEEDMGIRITEVMARPFSDPNIRASGFLLSEFTTRRVKDYDFKRPDKFSKIQIDNIYTTHCMFLRNLRIRLPVLAAGLSNDRFPASVDQCTFEESLQEMAKTGRFGLFAAENLGRHRPDPAAPAEGRFTVPSTTLLEEEGTAHSVAPDSRKIIDELANMKDYFNRQPVLVYHREGTQVSKALGQSDGGEALLSCLRGGWKNLVDLNLRQMPAGDPFSREPRIDGTEMVVIVTFNDADGKPAMVIVYPLLTLEPLMGVLG